MVAIQDFYNLHRGETCVIIGNGPSLGDIPNWFLEMYPSFGTNLIYKRAGFTPTYWTAVDAKIINGPYLPAINNYHADVPKFIPDRFPDWQAKHVYYFRHRPGDIWDGNIDGPDMLTRPGIAYANVTHVALQLAYYMGFELMLCVGLDQTGDGAHFYGQGSEGYNIAAWDEGYGVLRRGFKPRQIVNVSTRTEVKNLMRGDWREYAKSQVVS